MSTEKATQVVKPDWTIRVAKSDNKADGFYEVGLKEMDETTFKMAQKMIRNGDQLEAVKFILGELRVSGDDLVMLGWRYVNSASAAILDLVKPYDAELKKN